MKALAILFACFPIFLFGIGSDVTVDFTVNDEAGGAITNASVVVATRRDRIERYEHGCVAMLEMALKTDSNGHASAKFPCFSGEFRSQVGAPGFYGENIGNILFKREAGGVFCEKLIEHEKKVNVVLRRKISPIPMHVFPMSRGLKMPQDKGCFDYDLMRGEWLPPHGRGNVADLRVEFERIVASDVYSCTGVVRVLNGGACKLKKLPGFSFPSVYEADTNAVYVSELEFKSVKSSAHPADDVEVPLLSDDEYLVLRSRARYDAEGHVVQANYSKIYGPMKVGKYFIYEHSFFNPTPNDTNLEFDETRNLAPRRRR